MTKNHPSQNEPIEVQEDPPTPRLALPLRFLPEIPIKDGVRQLVWSSFGNGPAHLPGLSKDQYGEDLGTDFEPWAVLLNTPMVPLQFGGGLTLKELPNRHYKAFAKLLGRNAIPFDDREDLENAINAIIEFSMFPDLKDPWQQLKLHLKRVLKAGNEYLSLIRPIMNVPNDAYFVPPPQAVLASLITSQATEAHTINSLSGTRAILDACSAALAVVETYTRKRGKKPDREFKRLMEAVVALSGERTALPSNASKGGTADTAAFYSTPMLKFARRALELTLSSGKDALAGADLATVERSRAEKRLRAICGKTDGAVIDALRKALKNKPLPKGG